MSRHHKAIAGPRWQRVRRAAFDRDGWRCKRCGKAGQLEAHHVKPLSDGGDPFDLTNIETLCRSCHVGELQSPHQRAWAARLAQLMGERQ